MSVTISHACKGRPWTPPEATPLEERLCFARETTAQDHVIMSLLVVKYCTVGYIYMSINLTS